MTSQLRRTLNPQHATVKRAIHSENHYYKLTDQGNCLMMQIPYSMLDM